MRPRRDHSRARGCGDVGDEEPAAARDRREPVGLTSRPVGRAGIAGNPAPLPAKVVIAPDTESTRRTQGL